jgi:alcohol dehydrogenase (cytochrome c)
MPGAFAASPQSESWSFDRLDRLGDHSTTIVGSPRVIDTPVGKAIEFDGVDDALFVDAHPLAGADTFTWEAIFRPDGGAAEQRWFHLQEDGSDDRMLFEIRVIDGQWCLDSYVHSPGASQALLNRDRLHPLGAWYHVAAVYDGREFRNYVNGVQEGAAEIRFTPQRPGRSSVGVRFNKVNYFKGAIRAARFTRRALTPAEFLAVGQPTPTGTGATAFASRCASCHGTDGNGGELGPPITGRVASRTDEELRAVIRQGLTGAGMPAFSTMSDTETSDLVQHLRSLRARSGSGPTRAEIALAGGGAIAGLVLNRGAADLQLLGDDRKLHLLRKSGSAYRRVTSQADWPTYNGQSTGSRYSPLTQITPANAARLAPRWMFSLGNTARLQVTPVVVDGVMYVTSANECYALDAGNGREIWHYRRPRTKDLVGNAAGGINRGVGVAGNRVFMVTDHAHIIALDRFTGRLLWETEMADWRQNYNATGAPLPAGSLVVTGSSGGDEGVRGFVAAYDQATGTEAWRFWTVPRRGEPKSETWQGKAIDHPGATTWLTGTYDSELNTVYWPTGNPSPDLIGDDRGGDNLYSDSVVALDAKTGVLKWHFQFTPHDVWDYDAQETPALVDATWRGQPRKLLVQVNRNGFMYVLDRTNGAFLYGTQYAKNVTWASGLTPEGRPMVLPNMEPTREGKRVCPSLDGASNWYSTSFNPGTGLYYVQTNDKCGIFTRVDMDWEAGKGFMGGSFKPAPDEPAQRVLRAIDIQTGKTAWELPQTGTVDSWGGVLSTAGGVVIFGEDGGALMAADARDGKALWSFPTNVLWKASPMTYMFDNTQYVAVAAGSSIIAFALPNN